MQMTAKSKEDLHPLPTPGTVTIKCAPYKDFCDCNKDELKGEAEAGKEMRKQLQLSREQKGQQRQGEKPDEVTRQGEEPCERTRAETVTKRMGGSGTAEWSGGDKIPTYLKDSG